MPSPNDPLERHQRSSTGCRALIRAARNNTATELAAEKTRTRELEVSFFLVSERLRASEQEAIGLTAELARARAADAPSLLQSIELVLHLHALAIQSPLACAARIDAQQQTSPPSPQRQPAADFLSPPWCPLSPSITGGQQHRLDGLETTTPPSEAPCGSVWLGQWPHNSDDCDALHALDLPSSAHP